MAGPAPGVADLGGCDRRPVGQGHQQGQQEVPSHLPRSTLRGLVRSALRCLVWSGAWVVGRRKHMCHTAYLPHSIFATRGGYIRYHLQARSIHDVDTARVLYTCPSTAIRLFLLSYTVMLLHSVEELMLP